MRRLNLHTIRTGGAAATLVAALGFAFACSESPTEATLDQTAPLFKGKPCSVDPSQEKCDDPPPPPSTSITATLLDPAAGVAGVFSDGAPEADYADYTGDDVTDRFKLTPNCANDRHMSLKNVADLPADLLDNQSTCNDDGPNGGWVFFRLPDLFDITEDCGPGEANECPFPEIPSFDYSVKKNGKVVFQARGAFAPNAQYFVQDLVTGERYEFLFQDGHVDVAADSWHFTADEAHLYVGHQFVCVGTDDTEDPEPETAPENPGLCKDFPLSVDITVTQTP